MESTTRWNARPGRDRGFVLIAVLVIVGSSLLVATMLLWLAQNDAIAAAGAEAAARNRALAWSGLQAVMSRLQDQRDRILQSQLPILDSEYEIYQVSAAGLSVSRRGIVRLLAVNSAGAVLACESGKLDLNTIDADALANTGLMDPSRAQAIVAYRTARGALQSVDELLNIAEAGVNVQTLHGPIEQLAAMTEAPLRNRSRIRTPEQPSDQRASGEIQSRRVDGEEEEADVRGLADVLTVFSCEPMLQSNGQRKINLAAGWSDDLAAQIARQFGQTFAAQVKRAFDRGATFDRPAKVFQELRKAGVAPEDWPAFLDAFATQSDEYAFGRLDINTAPYEALLALPGVTAEQAARMVSVRQELTALERTTIAWPVIQQIIKPEEIDLLADRMTTRCWAYRVRLAAGEVDAQAPGAPLNNPVTYEAVIDLAADQPRIAYLRDMTQLQVAAQIAASVQQDFAATEFTANDSGLHQDGAAVDAGEDEAAHETAAPSEALADQQNSPAAVRADNPDGQGKSSSPPAGKRIGRWTAGH
jgi:DNA uptake protein ComE-like DNA-binding protein